MNKALLLCLFLVIGAYSFCQDSLQMVIPGKWQICYKWDTVDVKCDKPFNSYVFFADGRCQHGNVTIMNEIIPVMGRWKLQNGTLNIQYDQHPNFSFPPQTFSNIVFLTKDLFYFKALSTVEYPGHWMYYTLRRVE